MALLADTVTVEPHSVPLPQQVTRMAEAVALVTVRVLALESVKVLESAAAMATGVGSQQLMCVSQPQCSHFHPCTLRLTE